MFDIAMYIVILICQLLASFEFIRGNAPPYLYFLLSAILLCEVHNMSHEHMR